MTVMTTNAARYSGSTEGSLLLRLYPTFANANATSANAKMSMISSVRRRPRAAETSGYSGSTAGDGAVMLLTGASRRVARPRPRSRGPRRGRRQRARRDAERRRRRAHSARAGRPLSRGERPRARAGRSRAELGGAALGVLVLGRGHLGLVGGVRVVLGDPVLLRDVGAAAGIDGGADVSHGLGHLGPAARTVRGGHRRLVVRRDLVQLDPCRLVRAGPAHPEDVVVDAAVDDDLAAVVGRDVVLVLADPPEDVAAADHHREQDHQRGGHDRP